MTHREKVDHLIADLSARGVSPFTTAPPTWRMAWGLGLPLPPPHFMGFIPLALLTGAMFGLVWGLVMWLGPWRSQSLEDALTASGVVGFFFGLIVAAYYRRSASRLNLPRSWARYL
jgi:hypothetical protein